MDGSANSYTDAKIRAYLARIAYSGPLDLTPDTLRALQYAHVTHVPYENADIIRGAPLSMKPDDLYGKIVTRKRGGYCFELNGAFGGLLRDLGFDTADFAGRFLTDDSPEIPMRRHRVLVVSCAGERYVCDAGVGIAAPRYPLRLVRGEVQEQWNGEAYRVEWDSFYGHVIHQRFRGVWRPFYAFTEEPQADADFAVLSFWCEKHPDSIFNKEYMISLKTPGGRMTMDGNAFRVYEGDGCVREEVLGKDETDTYLARYFSIWF
ncbi:MAG: arylamine N-acetyltransferase [Firmicutes bacterium]|nr:arylamine N-acetyltransferase [Bacillota bacterium]